MNDQNVSARESVRYWNQIFFSTSIGRKFVMGLTGLGVAGFLMFHLFGNAFLLEGEASFNSYSKFLHGIPLLPIIELGLFAFFLLHVVVGILVTFQNLFARPVNYEVRATGGRANLASRTMIYTGGALLIFICYHLWTLIAGRLPDESPWTRVQSILANPISVAIYSVGFIALGTHLFHGFSSMMVTFGARQSRHDEWVDLVCRAGALILALGYAGLAFYFFLK